MSGLFCFSYIGSKFSISLLSSSINGRISSVYRVAGSTGGFFYRSYPRFANIKARIQLSLFYKIDFIEKQQPASCCCKRFKEV